MEKIICIITALLVTTATYAQSDDKIKIILKQPPPNAVVTEKPTFRWSPVIPSPKLYRLQVYKVGKGQDAAQACRTNRPIFEKDYKTTEAAWPSEVESTEDTYAWCVQGLYTNGKPSGTKSECYLFRWTPVQPHGK